MDLEEKYQIVKVIGKGANAVVLLVRDRRIHVLRAAKLISRGHQNKYPGATEQYLREAAFLKNLNHPYIPRMIEYFENRDYLCIIMDYIEGKTVADLIRRDGTIPEKQVVLIARQLCQVLEYLHMQRKPVIYGDLKPENIIRRRDGTISLVDFGAACSIYKYGYADLAVGTVGYAAPEVISREKTADEQTDIYSLGATLCMMLTGELPPEGKVRMVIQIRKHASFRLGSVVLKCLRKNRRYRYRNVAEIRKDLK